MLTRLLPHPTRRPPEGPVVCVVLDGVGIGRGDFGDAVTQARTPALDRLRALPSFTSLLAHGTSVGMPSDADMGNSEVGHNALGAGRIIDQGAKLVSNAIATGAIYGPAWRRCVDTVKASGEPLHFIGLLSDGNIHSHIDHLIALIERAALEGVAKVRVHALLDGRDVPARSALPFIDRLEVVLARMSQDGRDYKIASGGGRMVVTMDRYEADWKIVERGWDAHVRAVGRRFTTAREAVETLYKETGLDDQNLPAFVIADAFGPVGPIRDGAAVILFNFRGDRALELTRAFEEEYFDKFPRGPKPRVEFAGMTQYDGDLKLPSRFLVAPPAISGTMGELLAGAGVTQLAISETHKFGHVTYFWNGNRSEPFDPKREKYVEVPSDGPPLEHRPWMRAAEITDRLIAELDAYKPKFVRVNYANGDMIGHTGDLGATILAMEAVDLCLARVIEAVRVRKGITVVTADHGNAEQMFDLRPDGAYQVRTSHSLNRVPLAIVDPRAPGGGPLVAPPPGAGLSNVASTCLELLGFSPPESYRASLLAR
ncbi:2,3-bisphosphoglycerate-independent phosphoglycerate mutase [Nannocystis sp. RBIL2]|uniref:2,3-bisphosphoglycerate-independent phosphoglycerate mutase n=1 Tax=Nannocystis sp. RBIL2 TaxID=2996788 RepID=UPI00226F1126|nr:2,3-bisphosphoglycerate-independent phosphoglycerate mutase [Nannocystis sp. RBIL2]MCY1070737.1 2,3-bisphosphoglycerate-independent phosphoglycerate mutase [Nannocystis sp. RBIL2]